jgi:hypothetical protein
MPGPRPRRRGQGRGLDRRRPPRHRDARRRPAHRDALDLRQPHRPRDSPHPRQRHHPLHPRQPRRPGTHQLELVYAAPRPSLAHRRPRAAPLPEIHRPRQQPRLHDDEHEGVREHGAPALPRVVPVRSSTTTTRPPRGHHRRRPALPRPLQLRLRPADRHVARRRRRRHARPLDRRGHARHHHEARLRLLHLVERRPAHHVCISTT